jgi:mRNA interferase MazF
MNPRRGDLVTVASKGPYTGKPRPALVVQSNDTADLSSVVVCPITSELTEGAPLRVRVPPRSANSLRQASDVMVDKLSAVPRQAVSAAFGRVTEGELALVDTALRLLLAV